MANRYFQQFVLTLDKRQVVMAGQISLSAAAAVTGHTFNKLVSSVAKTATGEYTITLADKYVELKCLQITFEGVGDIVLKVKSTDVTNNKTLVVNTWDISSAAIADVSAASKIHVFAVFKDSTVA